MAVISAAEVAAKLAELGHPHTPARQGYLAEIAGATVILYHPNSKSDDGGAAPCELRAENITTYLDKGFTVERPPLRAPTRATRAG